ncbi:MAG: response regulator [Bacteroidota bacterium]
MLLSPLWHKSIYIINLTVRNTVFYYHRWLLALSLVWGLPVVCHSQEYPVTNGELWLTEAQLEDGSLIALDGDWEFYWNQLIDPGGFTDSLEFTYHLFPSLWNENDRLQVFGYATYRVHIRLPDNAPSIALSIPDYYSSFRIFANGEIVAENGTVATTKEAYTPYWAHTTAQLDKIEGNELELVLQISNFDHSKGGGVQSIYLGNKETISKGRELELAYAFALTGCLLMGGLFFFGLYLFGKHEKPTLFFSLFCLVFSYRMVGSDIYPLHGLIHNVPWIITTRLEYVSLFLCVLIFGWYTRSLYKKETSKVLIQTLSVISTICIIASLTLPPFYFSQIIRPYFVVIIVYILYASWVYILGVLHNKPGSRFALASTGVVFLVFIYEMGVYLGYAEKRLLVSFIGYIAFFFLQSLILSYRFAFTLKREKRKAEAALVAKSEFLSTMSHEIRTPLNAVIGLSGILSETKLNDEQREFINTIRVSGEGLLSIINNILDFSRLDEETLSPIYSDTDLPELVEDVFDLVASTASQKNIDFIYDIHDKVPHYISTDAPRLQQVLINLVGNAAKFTETGEILVRFGHERVGSSNWLEITVSDTGIGIPEDKIDRLFKRFSQVDSSTTRKYGGTGLGLVICKKIVQAFGGSIDVKSTPGKGTTFHFTYPFELSHTTKEQTPYTRLQGKHFAALDDNETNLQILTKQCQKAGLTLTTYTHPEDFLADKAHTDTLDGAIIDMQMPGMNGTSVARIVRNEWKSQIKLVLITSMLNVSEAIKEQHFDVTLSKPIRQSQLLEQLNQLFKEPKTRKTWEPGTTKREKIDPTPVARDLRILIAEDNVFNQKVALKILERLGQEADVSINGKKAVERAVSTPYDLIFMDMNMPEMDGLEATEHIKALSKPGDKTPIIIAMTANVLDEHMERCFQAGMDDFLTKPVTINSVKEMLEKWFPAHS